MKVQIIEDTLTDGSIAYGVRITEDEVVLDLDCVDEGSAIAL